MSVEGYTPGRDKRRRKIELRRSADGSLRPAGSSDSDDDIGDIWAQQERIRLAEAIEEDKKRKDRQNLKQQTGLVGIAKKDVHGITAKLKKELFGEQALNKPSAGDKLKAIGTQKSAELQSVLSQIKIPKPALGSKIKQGTRKTGRGLAKVLKFAVIPAGIAAILVVGYLTVHVAYAHYQSTHRKDYGAKISQPASISVKQKPPPVGPTQNHNIVKLLPAGKTIDDFGGWYTSHLAKIGNLYNYKDTIEGVTIVVGQQSLASQTGTSPTLIAQEVANYFGADNVVMAHGETIYLGTSKQNFQTVVFAKDETLVLIGAGGNLSGQIWEKYANSMQPSY